MANQRNDVENLFSDFVAFRQQNFSMCHQYPNAELLIRALYCLNKAQIMNPKNCERLRSCLSLDGVVWACFGLLQFGILNQENLEVILPHRHPDTLGQILCSLHHVGMLNPKRRELLATHPHIESMVMIFSSLRAAHILNKKNFNYVLAHKYLETINRIIISLRYNYILNQERFDIIIKYPHLENLSRILFVLDDARVLNEITFNVVIKHQYLLHFNQALFILHQARLLTPRHFFYIAENVYDEVLYQSQQDLLSEFMPEGDLQDLIMSYLYPGHIMTVLNRMYQAGILDHKHLLELENPKYRGLLSRHAKVYWWDDVSASFVKTNWPSILEATEQEEHLGLMVQRLQETTTIDRISRG